jgi:magnesium transporter
VNSPAVLPEWIEPAPGSIGTYLVTDVPLCGPDMTVAALQTMLVGRVYESTVDVAVCTSDDGAACRLLGLIPLERVLSAAPTTLARDLMDPDPPVVLPGLNQEEAAWRVAHHGESSLAVVDPDGVFRGLVPPARLLMVMLTEHDQDLAHLGGFLTSAASARHAMDEPVRARLWHRLPWLMLGLLGSAGAAALVRGFEADLMSDVRLAFFIPGIVYMADAVGTQTETLVIRGLSVGVPIRRVFRLETLTGLLVGLVLAAITLPAVWLVLGSPELALTLSLSLVAACAVATVVAMSLPWLMSRGGRDPAYGSGPLATVVQDLLSLVIYFAIASAIMG